MRKLIDFAQSCRSGVRFIFTSSIATLQNWDTAKGAEQLQNMEAARGSGYGESKYVAEVVSCRVDGVSSRLTLFDFRFLRRAACCLLR
jgi:thioester reductase-like protein